MDTPRNNDEQLDATPRHTAPNEAGIPHSKEELRELSRAFMIEHRAAFDELGS